MQVLKPLLPRVMLLLLLLAPFAPGILGQTGSPSDRDALLQQIKADATRHVKAGSPMQTQLIVDLYGNNNAGVTRLEVAQTYENEFIKQKNALEPSPWEKLRPKVAWIVVGILALALIFYKVLEKWISILIEAIGGRLWNKLASSRFFKSVALQRYQKALSERYSNLRIPFSTRPLKMREVYVPLRLQARPAPTNSMRFRL